MVEDNEATALFHAADLGAVKLAEIGAHKQGGRTVDFAVNLSRATKSLDQSDQDNGTATDCAICMQKLEAARVFWPCGHSFCNQCLKDQVKDEDGANLESGCEPSCYACQARDGYRYDTVYNRSMNRYLDLLDDKEDVSADVQAIINSNKSVLFENFVPKLSGEPEQSGKEPSMRASRARDRKKSQLVAGATAQRREELNTRDGKEAQLRPLVSATASLETMDDFQPRTPRVSIKYYGRKKIDSMYTWPLR